MKSTINIYFNFMYYNHDMQSSQLSVGIADEVILAHRPNSYCNGFTGRITVLICERSCIAQLMQWVGYKLSNRSSEIRFPVRAKFCSFITAFKQALRPTLTLIKWVPGDLPRGVKRTRREADHIIVVPRVIMRGANTVLFPWCHICPIWPPVIPLNLTYIFIYISQLSPYLKLRKKIR
jgi:hypothetical protein